MRAARAVRDEVLDARPDADLAMSVVWVEVLSSDSAEEAERSAGLFDDPRVRQFYDAERRVGRAFAPQIGLDSMSVILERAGVPPEKLLARFQEDFVRGPACVFDTVFVFDGEAPWGETAPEAAAWATQLDPDTYTGFDRERWFWDQDLRAELRRLAERFLPRRAPDGE